MKLTINIVA